MEAFVPQAAQKTSHTIIQLKVDNFSLNLFVPKGTKSVSYEFLRPEGL
jgi:hypothetical protein